MDSLILSFIVMVASYITLMLATAWSARPLAQLLPGVPVYRWSLLGPNFSFWTWLAFTVLMFPFSPFFMLLQAMSPVIDGTTRANVCVAAVKKGYVSYEEARKAWLSFDDDEHFWENAWSAISS